eukprot:scaffold18709_cov50-Attheya_sp.AAC.1
MTMKMMTYNLVFSLIAAALSLSFLPVSLSANDNEHHQQQPEAYQQRLVDWIRTGPNGFFHPSIVWKRLGPDGTSGPYAMHTTQDLPKGTTLLVVPRKYVIDSFKTYNPCVTVARMLEEFEKGDESLYAPYLSYLFDDTAGGTSTRLLPASWSNEGQDLLTFILNDGSRGRVQDLLTFILNGSRDRGLEPRSFAQASVFEKCGPIFRADNESTPLKDESLRQRAEDAYLFYISRSWTDKMVPVLDMFNHRNGQSLNVESSSAHERDEDIEAFACRDIKAGEQLQNTYSECMDEDCEYGAIKYEYDTQQIYSEYGFVELYPRRWRLGLARLDDDSEQGIIAEIDQDLETGKKTFQWIFETPTEATIHWISEQLARLKKIEPNVRQRIEEHLKNHHRQQQQEHQQINDDGGKHQHIMHFNIEHESGSILELYEGYLEVLELALEHKDDPVGVTHQEFRHELSQLREQSYAENEL